MLDRTLLEDWMAGRPHALTRFGLNEPVVVVAGALSGRLGVVVALVALEPEPVYTVMLGAGSRDVHLPESALGAA
jgi:hypothetical protein